MSIVTDKLRIRLPVACQTALVTAARTTAALDQAIGAGWRAVSAQDAHGYSAHCGHVQGAPRQQTL